MGARLRRSGKAGFVGLFVAVALIGSAWLAYATAAPKATSYPTTAIKVQGHGEVDPCRAVGKHGRSRLECSTFSVIASRNASGKIGGGMTIRCQTDPEISFHMTKLTSLTVVGNSATIGGTGIVSGKAFKGQIFTVDATATDNPDTFAATIHNGSTIVCTVSGAVRKGTIVFRP